MMPIPLTHGRSVQQLCSFSCLSTISVLHPALAQNRGHHFRAEHNVFIKTSTSPAIKGCLHWPAYQVVLSLVLRCLPSANHPPVLSYGKP